MSIAICAVVLLMSSNVITIDRTKPFNPEWLVPDPWNPLSIQEQDERSVALTTIDLKKVRFRTLLKPGVKAVKDTTGKEVTPGIAGEPFLGGDERMRRLKAGGEVRLDAAVVVAILSHPELVPESWKKSTGENPTYIFFDGTILQDRSGHQYVVYLYFVRYRWECHTLSLTTTRYDNYPSAVLVP